MLYIDIYHLNSLIYQGLYSRTIMKHIILVKAVLVLVFACAILAEGPRPEVVYYQDGDVVLGGLFALHYSTTNENACRFIREFQSLKRVEAMVYAINRINSDKTLLPGIHIGFQIYDTCFYDIVTLGRSMNFIPDRSGQICSCHNNTKTSYFSSQPESCSSRDTVSDDVMGGMCCGTTPLLGVVGAERSESSIQAATLMGLHQTPEISFLSTSDTLSDTNVYPYFLRTVPPDRYQVSAIIDILIHFGWSYVSFLFSDDEYGQSAYSEFLVQSQQAGICIAYKEALIESADQAVYDKTFSNLLVYPYNKAKAVVLFAHPRSAMKIFTSALNGTDLGRFTWIGSDGVAGVGVEAYEAFGLKAVTAGLLTTVPYSENLRDFDDDFSNLNPETSPNPWVQEFFSVYEKCASINSSDYSCLERIIGSRLPSHETLVMDAVYAYAYAMDALIADKCNDESPTDILTCAIKYSTDGRHIMPYLRPVKFQSLANGYFSFDSNGDGEGRYAIENYQTDDNGTLKTIRVGFWTDSESDGERLVLDAKDIRFYMGVGWSTSSPPASVCSEECGAREAKVRIPDTVVCCWQCDVCELNEIVVNETTCQACPEDALPDPADDFATCLPVDATPLLFYSWLGPFLTSISILGLISSMAVLIVYFLYFNDPLIQGSDVLLHLLILLGIILSSVVGIIIVLPPSVTLCSAYRFCGSLVYTIIYVPLAFKCVRLYRILKKAKATNSQEEAVLWAVPAQLAVFTVALVLQVAMETTWIIVYPSRLTPYPYGDNNELHIQIACDIWWAEPLSMIVCNVPFLLMCCIFSMLARHLPDNYHEARFIAFSAFGSCILIASFSVPYIAINLAFESSLYSAILMNVNSILVLVCVFVIKLYAVVHVMPIASTPVNSDMGRNTSGRYRYQQTRPRRTTTSSSTESTANLMRVRNTTISDNSKVVTFSDIRQENDERLINDQTQSTRL